MRRGQIENHSKSSLAIEPVSQMIGTREWRFLSRGPCRSAEEQRAVTVSAHHLWYFLCLSHLCALWVFQDATHSFHIRALRALWAA